MEKIPVGVSQCLLGEPVRFDGGHKHDRYLTEVLQSIFDFRPACPELAIGLGVPRKPIRLIATDTGPRVRGTADPNLDVTDALAAEADTMARAHPDLCGYIFMQKSPSCGLFRLKRHDSAGRLVDNSGRGAFAARLVERLPHLPVEESGRLTDPALRENFIARVIALHDWKTTVAPAPTAKKLVDFYSRYKYQLMAHHVPSYRKIGRLVADLDGRDVASVCEEFLTLFMETLARRATRGSHVNTLLHLRGYLRDRLDKDENGELDEIIDAYHKGQVPLVVPVTLLKHHLMKVDHPDLEQQTYWSPYPEKLGLRSVVLDNVQVQR